MTRTRTSTSGAPSKFATGTYMGNGAATQAIVDVNFQPKAVIIWEQRNLNAGTPQWKCDQDGANNLMYSSGFAGPQMIADMIISLDVDGFTVGDGTGSSNRVNINLITYTYIAFK